MASGICIYSVFPDIQNSYSGYPKIIILDIRNRRLILDIRKMFSDISISYLWYMKLFWISGKIIQCYNDIQNTFFRYQKLFFGYPE